MILNIFYIWHDFRKTISKGSIHRTDLRKERTMAQTQYDVEIQAPNNPQKDYFVKSDIDQFKAQRLHNDHNNQSKNLLRYDIDIADRDALSGLLTNVGFMRVYRDTFSYRTDTQGPLHADENGMLILLGITDFELIESVYGRSAAMNCLREVGRILHDFCTDTDKAGRLRRDEFAILMRNIDVNDALERLHHLSAQFNTMRIQSGPIRINFKVNIGLKPYKPGHTAEEILAGADLYRHAMIEEDRQMANLSSKKVNRGNHNRRLKMS